MKRISLLAPLLLIGFITYAQKNPNAGKSHFDQEKWVEYIEGDIPLVISVPHGGRVSSEELAIRDCKGAITGVDGNTIELAMAIKNYFNKEYKVTPHIIISHIARKHVDQNRELENGAVCDNKQNEKPWYTFHNYIDSAIHIAQKDSKRAMYIDLHGHGHKNQRLEIGYNLDKNQLVALLENRFDINSRYHSLTNLMKMDKQLNINDMLFGDDAFGTYLVNNGIAATPSKQDLVAKNNELFFSGGDNTRRYTSKNYPNVFGLQIECNGQSRKVENRKNTAKSISLSIVQFMNKFGGTNL